MKLPRSLRRKTSISLPVVGGGSRSELGRCLLFRIDPKDRFGSFASFGPCLRYVRSAGNSGNAGFEAVRVRGERRNAGIGKAMIARAIEIAQKRGCQRVELTSSASRKDARRFYERLGFVASHVGMKLMLK